MNEMATSTGIIIIATLAVSFVGLMGGVLLIIKEQFTRRWSAYFVSFAAGSILGATFLNLLPEAFDKGADKTRDIIMAIFIGILVFFILEKLLVWHHHAHEDETHVHTRIYSHNLATARPLIIVGDALHNLLDGAIIAIAFMTDTTLGLITSAAVIAHEIPQEIGDFSILISSGMAKARVLIWNIAGALIAVLGALIVIIARETFENVEVPILGFVIGNFIYIALADLLPTIQHERKLTNTLNQIFLIFAGIGVIWLLGTILPHE
ncbi:MAG: ZIP family metal transporter [Patescibacteria group bacterium]|nr:ZIP family metal transporter [Patescibacteria group bacterium]